MYWYGTRWNFNLKLFKWQLLQHCCQYFFQSLLTIVYFSTFASFVSSSSYQYVRYIRTNNPPPAKPVHLPKLEILKNQRTFSYPFSFFDEGENFLYNTAFLKSPELIDLSHIPHELAQFSLELNGDFIICTTWFNQITETNSSNLPSFKRTAYHQMARIFTLFLFCSRRARSPFINRERRQGSCELPVRQGGTVFGGLPPRESVALEPRKTEEKRFGWEHPWIATTTLPVPQIRTTAQPIRPTDLNWTTLVCYI